MANCPGIVLDRWKIIKKLEYFEEMIISLQSIICSYICLVNQKIKV